MNPLRTVFVRLYSDDAGFAVVLQNEDDDKSKGIRVDVNDHAGIELTDVAREAVQKVEDILQQDKNAPLVDQKYSSWHRAPIG